MFIVEGSDCLGKTTCAKRVAELAKARGLEEIEYVHMGRPDEKFDFFKDYKPMIKNVLVRDRFHISGIVYHPAGNISHRHLLQIEGWLLSAGSFIVVLSASNSYWYEEQLKKSTTKQMFSMNDLMLANARFKKLCIARDVYVDILWEVDLRGFPTDKVINSWIDEWLMRQTDAASVNFLTK